MKTIYRPDPLDTSGIELPENLQVLMEKLAKNVHEVWSAERIQAGWRYGEKRDDVLKTHPCLVPYEELPEAEKEYDRQTAGQTLKMIMKLGFEIRKK